MSASKKPLVFCKDCKWYRKEVEGGDEYNTYYRHSCEKRELKGEYDVVTGERVNYCYEECEDVNKNGKCKMFEKAKKRKSEGLFGRWPFGY